jgi:hypothetical protein
MGLIQEKPYRRLNRLTGLWEWVKPEPEQYNKKEGYKPIDVRVVKKRKR